MPGQVGDLPHDAGKLLTWRRPPACAADSPTAAAIFSQLLTRAARLGRRGHGLAIQAGIAHADSDVMVFSEAGRVIASRVTGGSDELDSQLDHLPRRIGMRVVPAAVDACFGVRLTGIQNGFRAIRSEVPGKPLLAGGMLIDRRRSRTGDRL